MRATYVDSSALVKLVVYEAETEALRKFLASTDQMTSSLVTRVELSRAVARRLPEAGAAVDFAAVVTWAHQPRPPLGAKVS